MLTTGKENREGRKGKNGKVGEVYEWGFVSLGLGRSFRFCISGLKVSEHKGRVDRRMGIGIGTDLYAVCKFGETITD